MGMVILCIYCRSQICPIHDRTMRVGEGTIGLTANFAVVIERQGSRYFQITFHYNIVDLSDNAI